MSEQTITHVPPHDWAAAIRGWRLILAVLIAVCVAIIATGLFSRLDAFPGLHGDEAWIGLRALEQQARGLFTLNGMNSYTGSLFPEIVTLSFSLVSPGVEGLRLPGGVLNGLALVLTASALWRHGRAALYLVLLAGSSLLFLFGSRIAWEVNALQNLLLAIILLAVTRLLRPGRSSPLWAFAFTAAFSIGCWNHAIFGTAALALAAAAGLVALKWPSEDTAKLAVFGAVNLLLQAVLLARYVVDDGPFVSHALPAIVVGLIVVAGATWAALSAEPHLVRAVLKLAANARVARLADLLIPIAVALSLLASPANNVAFFGSVSGVIMLERVASYVPGPIEMTALHARMALLLAVFAAALFLQVRNSRLPREQTILPVLLLWTIFCFPALRLAIAHIADRYYIIPQFLFFCALALAIDRVSIRGRVPLQLLLLAGFVHAQFTLFREITRDQDRPPIDTVRYGAYADTSRHFVRLDGLATYLRTHALCEVRSSSFFIAQPMQFLMKTGPACAGSGVVQVEYCASCAAPVPGIDVKVR